MPRPNQLRTIDAEALLASRIAFERESRGWSYERLADEMGAVGCPIQSSAIYKIEKARPRRRITVDELAGFAEVFQETPDTMLLPPGKQAAQLFIDFQEAIEEQFRAIEAASDALQRADNYIHSLGPDTAPTVARMFVDFMVAAFDDSESDAPFALRGEGMETLSRLGALAAKEEGGAE